MEAHAPALSIRPSSSRNSARAANERLSILRVADVEFDQIIHREQDEFVENAMRNESARQSEYLHEELSQSVRDAWQKLRAYEQEPNITWSKQYYERREGNETPRRFVQPCVRTLSPIEEEDETMDSTDFNLNDDSRVIYCIYCTERPKKPQYCNACHKLIGCQECLMRWFTAEDALRSADMVVILEALQHRTAHRRCPFCRVEWTNGYPDVRSSYHRILAKANAKMFTRKRRRGDVHRLLGPIHVHFPVNDEYQIIPDPIYNDSPLPAKRLKF